MIAPYESEKKQSVMLLVQSMQTSLLLTWINWNPSMDE